MSGARSAQARRAALLVAVAAVGATGLWFLLAGGGASPARNGPAPAAPPLAPSATREREYEHGPGAVQTPEEPRQRVAAIAAVGARLPDLEARDALRTLARDAADRVERGAAISALWAGGDRAYLEELAASESRDAAFVRAKIRALADRGG